MVNLWGQVRLNPGASEAIELANERRCSKLQFFQKASKNRASWPQKFPWLFGKSRGFLRKKVAIQTIAWIPDSKSSLLSLSSFSLFLHSSHTYLFHLLLFFQSISLFIHSCSYSFSPFPPYFPFYCFIIFFFFSQLVLIYFYTKKLPPLFYIFSL